MLFSTTGTLQGQEVEAYLGVVFGDAVLGINVLKDLFASVRDIVGGRSGTYERELGQARDIAMAAMARQAESLGAHAIIGIQLDYETLGSNGGMLMVTATGTAVRLRGAAPPPGPAQPSPWAR